MPNLELNAMESELLLEMAEEWLWDVRQEARRSDTPEHGERLKQKQALLERMVERLTSPVG
jgi:hypothetical protein